jgi:hypothetical protein
MNLLGGSYEDNLKKISEGIQKSLDPKMFLIGKEDTGKLVFKYGDGVDTLKEVSEYLIENQLVLLKILKYGESPCFISDLKGELKSHKKIKIRSCLIGVVPNTKLILFLCWDKVISMSKPQFNKTTDIINNLFINNLLAFHGFITSEKGAPIEVQKPQKNKI